MQNVNHANQVYQDSLVWDAHAGVFPSPDIDLNLLQHWQEKGANYLSINVGFDVMDWQQTLATLAAYRRWLANHSDRFVLDSVRSVTCHYPGGSNLKQHWKYLPPQIH